MPNPYFQFKQFTVFHDRTAMKVTTDACLFGAWSSEMIKNRSFEKGKALEIGAGTGLLSLMLAQKNEIEIDAVEIEVSAAGQASENIAASPWKERIHIHHSDILQFERNHSYDCIFSNPPFYESEIESVSNQKNIAHHSAGLKLNELFTIISEFLQTNGIFLLLLPYKRHTEIEQLLLKHKLYLSSKILVRQSVLHQSFRIMLMGTKQKLNIPVQEEVISIWNELRQYTPEFIHLLKDYYLYL